MFLIYFLVSKIALNLCEINYAYKFNVFFVLDESQSATRGREVPAAQE